MLAGFLAALEGQVLDRKYHLRKLRGIGTFGAVFEADEVVANTVTRRRLAVKVMLSDASSSDRQLRELSLASRLDHHGIIRCYVPGHCQVSLGNGPADLLYLVMELADETLDARILSGFLGLDDALGLARQLVDALVYLHGGHIVHRDIKPSNVLRVAGTWKLGDLGIFRYLGDETSVRTRAVGSWPHMPPEAFDGEVSTAWDIWSLGVTLMQSVTGRVPYYGHNDGEFSYLIKTQEPEIPSDIPEPLGGIIRGCLLKDRTLRPTAAQLRGMLRDAPRKPIDIGPGAVLVGPGGRYRSIAEAVAEVTDGARIYVQPGVYPGTVRLKREVEIHGLGAVADVVIDGRGDPCVVANAGDLVSLEILDASRRVSEARRVDFQMA